MRNAIRSSVIWAALGIASDIGAFGQATTCLGQSPAPTTGGAAICLTPDWSGLAAFILPQSIDYLFSNVFYSVSQQKLRVDSSITVSVDPNARALVDLNNRQTALFDYVNAVQYFYTVVNGTVSSCSTFALPGTISRNCVASNAFELNRFTYAGVPVSHFRSPENNGECVDILMPRGAGAEAEPIRSLTLTPTSLIVEEFWNVSPRVPAGAFDVPAICPAPAAHPAVPHTSGPAGTFTTIVEGMKQHMPEAQVPAFLRMEARREQAHGH